MLFRPNPNFAKELQAQPEFTRAKVRVAEAAKRKAEALSPKETGHYARQFVVTEEDGEVKLGNRDIAAHLIEWGSSKNAAHAPLRRGVRAAGLTLRESSK